MKTFFAAIFAFICGILFATFTGLGAGPSYKEEVTKALDVAEEAVNLYAECDQRNGILYTENQALKLQNP